MRFSVPLFRMALKSTIVNMVVPTNYFLIHFLSFFKMYNEDIFSFTIQSRDITE